MLLQLLKPLPIVKFECPDDCLLLCLHTNQLRIITKMESANTLKIIGRYSYYTNQCLGQGSFGKVYEGFENNTKLRVAIKKIDLKMFEKDSYLEQSIYSEIKILNKCKHPNIVELYEVLNSKRSMYIVMEYCGDGDLKKYLKLKGRLSEDEAYQVMKQVASGFR